MRRRQRHRQQHHSSQNLDSFLDILTNTVGVLMFISLFVSLIAVEGGTVIRTPLVSSSLKRAHFFEVRENKITYVDDVGVDRQIQDFLSSSGSSCQKPDLPENIDTNTYDYYLDLVQDYENCLSNRLEKVKDFRPKTDYYEVKLVNLDSFSWLYEPIKGVEGEPKEEFSKANSEFSTILSKLNPNLDYVAFIVRPDSFEAFRAARQQAWKEGFDVGWEPRDGSRAIVFGSGGRTIGVQ